VGEFYEELFSLFPGTSFDANSHLVPLQITKELREKNNLIKYHLSGTTCDEYY
jgi:hypothetical protein